MSLIAIGPGSHTYIDVFGFIPPVDGEQQPDVAEYGTVRVHSTEYGGMDKGKVRVEFEPNKLLPAYLGVPTATVSEVDGKQVIEIELVVPTPSPTP